jgi:isoleucyl-tRNA synthetase
MTGMAMRGDAPYKTVLTHGFTVDARGHKMSKSKGNVVAPQQVLKTLGADILRLWVASTDYRGEMAVSDEILKRTADAYRRIRNTARYFLANLDGFDPDQHILAADEMLALDKWAVQKAERLQDQVIDAYNKYEFHRIYHLLHNFCVSEMGGFYLDIIKDRIYTCQTDSVPRRSAQTALFHIAHALVRWMAPIMSFTAQEIWQHMPGDKSDAVFLETWYELPVMGQDADKWLAYWDKIIDVREHVAKELEQARTAGVIGSSLDAEVGLYCGREILDELAKLEDELRFVLITSYARIYLAGDPPAEAQHHSLRSGDEVYISVSESRHNKCVRCWHHREDVGSHSEHPELCGRCVENVDGTGEERHYA